MKRYKILSSIKPTGFCLECGNKITDKKRRKYCSEKCNIEYYNKNDTYRFRVTMLKKYNYTCKKCGYIEKPVDYWERSSFYRSKLHIHHIKPLKNGGELFDKKNVMVLCTKCHMEMHRILRQGDKKHENKKELQLSLEFED